LTLATPAAYLYLAIVLGSIQSYTIAGVIALLFQVARCATAFAWLTELLHTKSPWSQFALRTRIFEHSRPAPGLGIGPGGADGNTPRDCLRAPGYRDVDLGIFRNINFERGISLQLRGEATNAFNLVSLSAPTASLASSLDGKITSASTPRVIQVGIRLTF
jgi:hypothetical protein